MHRHTLQALCANAVVGLSLTFSTPSAAQDADLYFYDVHGRLTAIQRPSNNTTTYSLDAADNRQARADYDQFDAIWQAESLPHIVGYAATGGWEASAGVSAGFMTYGPYTTTTPVGMNVASWRIRVDSITTLDTLDVVTFDVWDATASTQLGALTVKRAAWAASDIYQDFEVPFALVSSASGHFLEFRTYYHPSATVIVDELGYRHTGDVWLAATELYHQIGYADSNGWVADTTMTPSYMTFGPYASAPVGAKRAVWRMMVDNISTPDTLPVVTLDVWDSTASEQLAAITLDRHAWAAANTFQDMRLPFMLDSARAGHTLEFRTRYDGNAKVTIQWVGVE